MHILREIYFSIEFYTILKTTNGGGSVGVESILKNENLSLYPNPFGNFLNIENPDDLKINQIIITNQLGQTVYESNEKDIILAQSLIPGIYNVVLITDKGTHSISVVKN